MWLRNEVRQRRLARPPAPLWGWGRPRVGAGHGPRLLCEPTWLLEQGHPQQRSDLSYKGPQGCTVVLNRRKRITHFSLHPLHPSFPARAWVGGGHRQHRPERVGPSYWDTLLHPMLPVPGWRPLEQTASLSLFLMGRGACLKGESGAGTRCVGSSSSPAPSSSLQGAKPPTASLADHRSGPGPLR